ncbi:peptidyl-prolyl cis-trans isomerase, FKBP-type family protein [Histomonas meleagridis]|uniref:peptidyl-prolyl cis-trans isomerase, FKBP-type family protein n=1 Tax=Histomonas meleagridis TaxID=135588 RepID=UPI00355961B5|nr:peptidyl-prolyl cis-trans isomerase, FKBP-type family protein [Histomonas meleagridis]KAH0804119.1 peptidyl-prolyl cis-trans isomerase, FKBP-type family protein [Histomonas meleagridis]
MFLLPLFINHVFSLKKVSNQLKIGIIREAKTCKKFVEDENMVYAHIVARVEGKSDPIYDTYKENKPMYFKANNTHFISGFNLGIRGACEGEIRRITIPPELAYKGEYVEGLFEPYSTWIVDAEILEVIKEQVLL